MMKTKEKSNASKSAKISKAQERITLILTRLESVEFATAEQLFESLPRDYKGIDYHSVHAALAKLCKAENSPVKYYKANNKKRGVFYSASKPRPKPADVPSIFSTFTDGAYSHSRKYGAYYAGD